MQYDNLPSLKQQNLIRILIEHYGKGGDKSRSLADLLLEAGYSEASAKNPKLIIEGTAVQRGLSDFVKKMDKERNRIINALETKDLHDERYRDLVDGLDKLTKNIQLLSGEETERQGVTINLVNYGDNHTS